MMIRTKGNSEDNLKKTHAQDRPENEDVTKANCEDDLRNTRVRDMPKDNDEMNRYGRGNQSYIKKYGNERENKLKTAGRIQNKKQISTLRGSNSETSTFQEFFGVRALRHFIGLMSWLLTTVPTCPYLRANYDQKLVYKPHEIGNYSFTVITGFEHSCFFSVTSITQRR